MRVIAGIASATVCMIGREGRSLPTRLMPVLAKRKNFQLAHGKLGPPDRP